MSFRAMILLKNIMFLLMLKCVSSTTDNSELISYEVKEETDIGSFIGNLRVDSKNPKIRKAATFIIYDENDKTRLFRLDTSSGKLFIAKRIDLETLCSSTGPAIVQPSATSFECQIITIEVLVNMEFFINVRVHIIDINDNSPSFGKFSDEFIYTVNVSESAEIGYALNLDEASDPDLRNNGIQSYNLSGEDFDAGYFRINYTPPYPLSLIVAKALDAESKQYFTGQLIACDGGYPESRCTSQKLLVKVLDVNDNMPIFEKEVYEITISEATEIGSVILTVKATDADVESNSRISYELGQSPTRPMKKKFSIDPKSGEIFLSSQLDVGQGTSYELIVVANDGSSRMGHAKVIIRIIDVNDNQPWVKVRNIGEDHIHALSTHTLARPALYFKENQPAESPIGLIICGDDDLGDNSIVDCELVKGKESFRLNLTSFDMTAKKKKKAYLLHTRRTFDREAVPSGKIEITIRCFDQGTPQLTTEETIDVNVIDVNEFSPYFDPNLRDYYVEVFEDTPPGTLLFEAKATDNDATAIVHYKLSTEATEFFEIGQQSGKVTLSKLLNRENQDEINFEIYATDVESPALRDNGNVAMARATVRVLDVNDNKPILEEPHVFSIYENMPGQQIGRLTAFDPDQGNNGTVLFRLIAVRPGSRFEDNLTFALNGQTGELASLKPLDREETAEYSLSVELYDLGEPRQITSTSIQVRVNDRNDNSPQWEGVTRLNSKARFISRNFEEHLKGYSIRPPKYPQVKDLGILIIPAPLIPGFRLLRLSASDKDSPPNANLTFTLKTLFCLDSSFMDRYRDKNNNQQEEHSNFLTQFFLLNEANGDLTISSGPDNLGIKHSGVFELHFLVNDNGKPARQNMARLFVNVSKNPADDDWLYLASVFDSNNSVGLNLIIIMVTLTGLVSLCMLIAIILVRRKGFKYQIIHRLRRRQLVQPEHLQPYSNHMPVVGSPLFCPNADEGDKWLSALPYSSSLFNQYLTANTTPNITHKPFDTPEFYSTRMSKGLPI
ncbi:Protocadherin-1 [Cichlidogyrus casuarinus]|uniref:Protocadherin-1 n=1 Tax=Cichlidogyrus casuarinus TaxID=1844966 RepID=A0ABD2Q5N5_9PLAT